MSKHEEIAESLTRDILVGQYRCSERLPSERDLAARFDANRGAVREAMKKLEQLGIAHIQPGGARVAPLQEASLDVIGYLLTLDDIPNPELVDQILVVIAALVKTAAVAAVDRVSDAELEGLRALVRPMWAERLDEEAQLNARINMFHGFMTASGNLPVQLIARTLVLQFGSSMETLHGYGDRDTTAYSDLTRALDEALATRDRDRIQTIFDDLSALNRKHVMRAIDAYQADRGIGRPEKPRSGAQREVAAS